MKVEWKFLENGTMEVKTPVWKETQILPEYIAQVFKTKEIMRTQEITQNGYSSIDIPELDKNTRWGHQIMVVQLEVPFIRKVQRILEENDTKVDADEVKIAEMVFASHDVGHTDNSHQSESILKYSHEQRTIDVLLGDTELGRLMCKQFPREKVEKIVQIITKIDLQQGNMPKEKLSPFLQIYAQLVSSGGDLDKVAYTLGDTIYAGVKSSLDPKKLLSSFGINVDVDGNYILQWNEDGQRQLEILDIERFQNYRDIYFNPSAEIMRYIEPVMLKLAEQESDRIKNKLPQPFLNKIKANQSEARVTSLEEELEMTNVPMNEAWKILAEEAENPILRYLADFNGDRKDYHFFETKRELSDILAQLQEIFPDRNLSDTNSLFEVTSKCKMIKPSEDPWIGTKSGNLRKASEKDGCLIKPENFIRRRVFFNPELLRLELEMSKEQFEKYQTEIDWLIDELDSKEDEFQDKYLLKDQTTTIEDIIAFMQEKGFEFEGSKKERNEDDYLENLDLGLLKSGREFRIRQKTTANGNTKHYIDYKEPIAESSFSHRNSIKRPIRKDENIEEMKQIIEQNIHHPLEVEDKTFLHVSTNRTILLFKRNGKKIYISWDESTYNNKWIGEKAQDTMLEIGIRGENADRLILKGVQQLMQSQADKWEPYNGSKIERGAFLTYRKKQQQEKEDGKERKPAIEKSEKELKCKFRIEDREAIMQIVRNTLESYKIMPIDDAKLKPQVDEYFDTPEYSLAQKENSLRIRESKTGEIEGTYKLDRKRGKTIFNRTEAHIQIQEKSAKALIQGAKEQYGISLPEDIISSVFVENQRLKQNYDINGINLELAFDDIVNVDAKTGRRKKAPYDEFEIEFKSDITPEKAEEIIERIWITILKKCSEQGISIQKSTYNKYVCALIDLEIIPDKEQTIEK